MIRGRWVKLVVEGSASWRRLPLAVRSIGYAVSTVVDEDGSLECGDERPADVLVRLLAAHPDERKLVRALLAKLAASGFLVVDGPRARLLDPSQTPANGVAITPAKGGRNGGAMGVAKVPPHATGNTAESLVSQNERIDQTRPDQTRIPSPNPLPQAEGGSAVEASPSKAIEQPATSVTCSTVEQLGTDPHEVALVLGASVPRLRHFPGGARDDFRRAAAPLRIEWPVLAAWFAAGGVRRHRSGRATWSWLLGHGGGPLAECWALAQEWASKGRPALDDRGEIAAPKPAPEAAKPSPLRVVASPLAWLEGAPARISPEAIERAKAQAAAKVANG